VKVRVERVLDGVAYATLVRSLKKVPEPLTAEAEAEKPTRKPPARKDSESQAGTIETDDDEVDEGDELEETDEDLEDIEVDDDDEPQAAEPEVADPDVAVTADGTPVTPVKKKTRRGSRGGKNRKKPAGATAATKPVDAPEGEAVEAEPEMPGPRLPLPQAATAEKKVTIHLPSDDLGREDEEEDAGPTVETPSENGAPGVAKKKTRRGSRGGKNRRKRTAAAATGSNGAEAEAEVTETVPTEPAPVEPAAAEAPSTNGAPEDDWGYVPMSEWVDELDK
jgi:hypothetical protein